MSIRPSKHVYFFLGPLGFLIWAASLSSPTYAQGVEGSETIADTLPRVAGIRVQGWTYPTPFLPVRVSDGVQVCIPHRAVTVDGAHYRFTQWTDGSTASCTTAREGFALVAQYEKVASQGVAVDTYPSRQGSLTAGGQVYPPDLLPTPVPDGARVCVTEPVLWTESDQRLAFTRWTNGDTQLCTLAVGEGSLFAIYETQYRLEVLSEIGEVQGSGWYPRGVPATIGVDTAAINREAAETRYRFLGWSGLPGAGPQETLIITEPRVVEAEWEVLHRVEVQAPHPAVQVEGTGYHPAGSVVVLAAPPVVTLPGQQWRLKGWRVGALRMLQSEGGMAEYRVERPTKVEPVYEVLYPLTVDNPYSPQVGLSWHLEGSLVVVETPREVEVSEQEKLVFTEWREDLVSPMTKATVIMDGPKKLQGVYERRYLLHVRSPHGATGEGFYPEGAEALVRAPEHPRSYVFTSLTLEGWGGDARATAPEVWVSVDGPKTVQALYRMDVNYTAVLIAAGALLAGAALYLLSSGRFKWRSNHRPMPNGPSKDVVNTEQQGL